MAEDKKAPKTMEIVLDVKFGSKMPGDTVRLETDIALAMIKNKEAAKK